MANAQFNIDFMGKRKIAAGLSTLLIIGSIVTLALQGLNFGLDFTGGNLVEVEFEQAADPNEVRGWLDEAGFENAVVQNFGTDVDLLVRMPPQPQRAPSQACLDYLAQSGAEDVNAAQACVPDDVLRTLQAKAGDGVVMRRSEFVGPAVGEELREQGGLAMLTALGMVMIYIMFRFTGKFSVGAVVALVHDVIIVLGAFSVFRWGFDLPALAAVLAVVGYSLNDTIVVSDRIRENFREMRKGGPIEVINRSLNQTLGRTLVTSLTTLLVLLALLLFGGEQVEGFADALLVGVIIGTYSSIYVAANVLVAMGIDRQDLIIPEKEGAEEDPVP